MDHNQLREDIKTFSLVRAPSRSQGFTRVLLQLFGFTGHGKSSFINSCKYAMDEESGFIEHAEAGMREDGGVTMTRKTYHLTDAIILVDNRGCTKMNSFERIEVYTQLGNFLPLDGHVEWKDDFGSLVDRVEDMDIDTYATDLLVPVFVYSVESNMTPDLKESLPTFFKNCTELTGLSPLVVLTHKFGGNFFETEKQLKLLGAENVMSVENYTRQDHIKTRQRTLDFLNFLKTVLHNVTFRLEQTLEPRKERVKHKKFLLRYIHHSVLEDEKEKETKERMKQAEEERLRNRGYLGWVTSYWYGKR